MIDLAPWMDTFLQKLDTVFGSRIWFVGLQGSYARGEATEGSDLDVVVILDQLTPADIQSYSAMLDSLPHRALICGFLSGRVELLSWEPSDLFQFYHDTKPLRGSLDDLLPLLSQEAISRAIKIGACNIYHGCVHNMLHEKSGDILKALYKSASFVVQAVDFQKHGTYTSGLKVLEDRLDSQEQQVIRTFRFLKEGGTVDFQPMSEALFSWAQKQIHS